MGSVIKTVLTLILLANLSFAKEVGGVDIPQNMLDLKLNGAGIRNKFFFDLYVGALYLLNEQHDAKTVVSTDEKMAIKLHIISSMITSEKMESATREGFENSVMTKSSELEEQIEAFISVFQEEIKIGDVYDLIYTSEAGLDIYKNTQYKKTIKGLAFKQALFGIWLGEKPAQKSLKDKMLGD